VSTEKKPSDDAENSTALTNAGSNYGGQNELKRTLCAAERM